MRVVFFQFVDDPPIADDPQFSGDPEISNDPQIVHDLQISGDRRRSGVMMLESLPLTDRQVYGVPVVSWRRT